MLRSLKRLAVPKLNKKWNKKGLEVLSYKMIMWVPRLLYTIIVIGVTFLIISGFIVTKANVSEAESYLLADVAYYSDKGFSYVDDLSDADDTTRRVYTGVIDVSKFSSSQLGSLLGHKKPIIVGRFVKKQTIIDYFLKPEADVVAYTDKARYELWQPIAQVEGKGEGGKMPYAEVRHVTMADGKMAVVETVFIAST